MEKIKRAWAASHKKNHTTTAIVKVEYATRKRAYKLNVVDAPPNKKHKATISILILKIIIPTAIDNAPKNKTDRLLMIGKTKVNLAFHNTPDNYTNYLP